MGEDKPSPLAASWVRLQCLGESTDGEVIDPVKARSRISLPFGCRVKLQRLGESTDGEVTDPAKATSGCLYNETLVAVRVH